MNIQGTTTVSTSISLAAETRTQIRDALKRADLSIAKTVNGPAPGDKSVGKLAGKLITYQVTGDRVSDPTKRYYLSTRLQNLSEKLGVHIEIRRVRRNAEEVFIDVFPDEETAEAAHHSEDERRAKDPTTPASKYYFRRKTGMTQHRHPVSAEPAKTA